MSDTDQVGERTAGTSDNGQSGMPGVRRRPVLVVKCCRGRLGGSAKLLTIIQRARWNRREVIVIDGDENSQTLRAYYPPGQPGGAIVPNGTDAVAFKELMMTEMSAMVSDRISRVVDISGGSKDMDEVMAELNLSDYCADYGIDLVAIGMLGPDPEDFRHVIRAIEAGYLRPKDILLVMNQGVLRGGNLDAAFVPIIMDPLCVKVRSEGAKAMIMPRLPVMNRLRDDLADFYEVAHERRRDGSPWRDRSGALQPVWSHMSKRYLRDVEVEYQEAGVAEILP